MDENRVRGVGEETSKKVTAPLIQRLQKKDGDEIDREGRIGGGPEKSFRNKHRLDKIVVTEKRGSNQEKRKG